MNNNLWALLSNGVIFSDRHGPLTRFSRSRQFWSRISGISSYRQSL